MRPTLYPSSRKFSSAGLHCRSCNSKRTILTLKSAPHSSELPSTRTRQETSRKKKAKSSPKASGQPKTIAGSALVLASEKPLKARNVARGVDSRNRRKEALRRLGVKAEQLVDIPQISHILKHAEHGLRQVIDALRGHDEEDAQAFIRKYDSLSASDRKHLTIEDICVAAQVRKLDHRRDVTSESCKAHCQNGAAGWRAPRPRNDSPCNWVLAFSEGFNIHQSARPGGKLRKREAARWRSAGAGSRRRGSDFDGR